jgi:hypothetical protein
LLAQSEARLCYEYALQANPLVDGDATLAQYARTVLHEAAERLATVRVAGHRVRQYRPSQVRDLIDDLQHHLREGIGPDELLRAIDGVVFWSAFPPAFAALVLLRRVSPRIVRVIAAAAVATPILAWAMAQYPYLLGDHTPIFAASASRPSLITLTVVFTAAAVLVAPSLVLLFTLQQRTHLHNEP